MQFDKYKNFYLSLDGWGDGCAKDIIKLLDNVIEHFYVNLNGKEIVKKDVYINNSEQGSPPLDYPYIIKESECNIIYLSASGRNCSQYSYQFAHELCHHVINSKFYLANDRFGWFEESLCELASIFCIDRMSESWEINPPYENWRNYSTSLAEYISNIINKPELVIFEKFKEWLSDNLNDFYKNRYKRLENRIVALHLLPIFIENPKLWQTIQYMRVDVTDDMTLGVFINAWMELLPDELKILLNKIKMNLID